MVFSTRDQVSGLTPAGYPLGNTGAPGEGKIIGYGIDNWYFLSGIRLSNQIHLFWRKQYIYTVSRFRLASGRITSIQKY